METSGRAKERARLPEGAERSWQLFGCPAMLFEWGGNCQAVAGVLR